MYLIWLLLLLRSKLGKEHCNASISGLSGYFDCWSRSGWKERNMGYTWWSFVFLLCQKKIMLLFLVFLSVAKKHGHRLFFLGVSLICVFKELFIWNSRSTFFSSALHVEFCMSAYDSKLLHFVLLTRREMIKFFSNLSLDQDRWLTSWSLKK